ncbi:MAG: hypothetical protein HYX75_07955 [Acidobacteria bacterium]|nr:hypothetical protein [Acidobacteriota bacterium]
METTPTTNSSNIDPNLLNALTNSTSMGKDDFLMLLVSQLRNQDPLEPLKDTEFVTQLATFSSLEQLASMNATLMKIEQLLTTPATTTDDTQGT